jgi:hypothetical protein
VRMLRRCVGWTLLASLALLVAWPDRDPGSWMDRAVFAIVLVLGLAGYLGLMFLAFWLIDE